jgi:hypothetical protein
MRVVVLDEVDLPVALPFLQLLLAMKCSSRGFVNLEPDESLALVPSGEAGDEFVLVLPNSPRESGCRADVKGSRRLRKAKAEATRA